MLDPRDNPIWSALNSRHCGLSMGTSRMCRYAPDVAPFLGVAPGSLDKPDEATLGRLLPAGDTVYLLGEPPRLGDGWSLRWQADLAQMVAGETLPRLPEGDAIRELGSAECSEVLALTALVYPHYFRRKTMQLGRYFGIYREGRLAAMVGERMCLPGHTEISAVCTHPDFAGQGLARRLFVALAQRLHGEGLQPFLHVSTANTRAVELYERNGFVQRRLIPFWSLQRAA